MHYSKNCIMIGRTTPDKYDNDRSFLSIRVLNPFGIYESSIHTILLDQSYDLSKNFINILLNVMSDEEEFKRFLEAHLHTNKITQKRIYGLEKMKEIENYAKYEENEGVVIHRDLNINQQQEQLEKKLKRELEAELEQLRKRYFEEEDTHKKFKGQSKSTIENLEKQVNDLTKALQEAKTQIESKNRKMFWFIVSFVVSVVVLLLLIVFGDSFKTEQNIFPKIESEKKEEKKIDDI